MSLAGSMAKQQLDRHLDELIDLLVENATVVMSGTKIASQLRVPPSTLWDWMERLRELGAEVRGLPGTGYQLIRVPDGLTARTIRRSLPAGPFRCPSTPLFHTCSNLSKAGGAAGG